MKQSPDAARLEEILRSSKLVSGGFLGMDARPLEEIVEADAAALAAANCTVYDIADRMRHITALAERGLGTPVMVDDMLEAVAADTRGRVACPWPHRGRFQKTVVTVRRLDGDRCIRWSALNIHMIEAHGFFEGRGAAFRLDPKELIGMIF